MKIFAAPPKLYEDVTMADLRPAVHWFMYDLALFESSKLNGFILRDLRRWRRAVKVPCSGDWEIFGLPEFQDVWIRHDMRKGLQDKGSIIQAMNNYLDRDFTSSIFTSAISVHMGFPLQITRFPYALEIEQPITTTNSREARSRIRMPRE